MLSFNMTPAPRMTTVTAPTMRTRRTLASETSVEHNDSYDADEGMRLIFCLEHTIPTFHKKTRGTRDADLWRGAMKRSSRLSYR